MKTNMVILGAWEGEFHREENASDLHQKDKLNERLEGPGFYYTAKELEKMYQRSGYAGKSAVEMLKQFPFTIDECYPKVTGEDLIAKLLEQGLIEMEDLFIFVQDKWRLF